MRVWFLQLLLPNDFGFITFNSNGCESCKAEIFPQGMDCIGETCTFHDFDDASFTFLSSPLASIRIPSSVCSMASRNTPAASSFSSCEPCMFSKDVRICSIESPLLHEKPMSKPKSSESRTARSQARKVAFWNSQTMPTSHQLLKPFLCTSRKTII